MERDLTRLLLRILALRPGIEEKHALFNVLLPEINRSCGAERSSILACQNKDGPWLEVASHPHADALRREVPYRPDLALLDSFIPVVSLDESATQLLLPWKTGALHTNVLCLRWEADAPPAWVYDEDAVASFGETLGNYLAWEQVLFQIASAKRDLQSIFDSLPSAVAMIRSDHTIERINSAFAERFNVSYKDAIGKRCYEIVHETGRAPAACRLCQVLESNAEVALKIDEGRCLCVTQIPYQVGGDDPKIIEIIEAESSVVKDSRAGLSYRFFKLYEMISQPLTSISITSQLLQDDPYSPGNARKINILCDEVRRMIDILKDGWEGLGILIDDERRD